MQDSLLGPAVDRDHADPEATRDLFAGQQPGVGRGWQISDYVFITAMPAILVGSTDLTTAPNRPK